MEWHWRLRSCCTDWRGYRVGDWVKKMRCLFSEVLQGEAGSDLAEAALVLPLMFTILLGIFWFGQAFSIYGTITHAAREGARAAVAPLCATCGTALTSATVAQNAVNALQNALLAAKLNPAQPKKYPITPPTLFSCINGT